MIEADKRSIGNVVQLFFDDVIASDKISVDYPIGYRCRREEGILVMQTKFARNLERAIKPDPAARIHFLLTEDSRVEAHLVNDVIDL